MSSFFTLPASQRKRKRDQPSSSAVPRKQAGATGRPTKRRATRDESISGSDFEDDGRQVEAPSDVSGSDSESDGEDEDAAGRRTRLAERYLENTRQQILAEGFDAKDIDAELLAERTGERLKEDTAEGKGKLYRWIADEHDFAGATRAQFRADTQALTGVATCAPYTYTVSKDMTLIKWEMRSAAPHSNGDTNGDSNGVSRRNHAQSTKPKQLIYTRGNGKRAADPTYQHHTAAILCVVASADGKFVATGGKDRKLIVWDAATLKPLKVFTQHRDSVTSLCFRRGTNQLFSSSKDRTIKTWSLDELAYVETLFGHQDEVVDVTALNEEKCVTVGARDRTARLWRVVEESQLVFRGGGGPSKHRKNENGGVDVKTYNEGSMDRVAMADDETFITGSDNGSLSLWNIQKKKAVFIYPLAHGVDPPLKPEEASAEMRPDPKVVGEPQPRWITALACLPFSNIVVSGSWDGEVRVWKISEDKRRLEPLGAVGRPSLDQSTVTNGDGEARQMVIGTIVDENASEEVSARGVVNDLSVYEKGDRGKDGLGIVAAVGKEHRLGRWLKVAARNYAVSFDVPKTGRVAVEDAMST